MKLRREEKFYSARRGHNAHNKLLGEDNRTSSRSNILLDFISSNKDLLDQNVQAQALSRVNKKGAYSDSL